MLRGKKKSVTLGPSEETNQHHKKVLHNMHQHDPIFDHRLGTYAFLSSRKIPRSMFDKFRSRISEDNEIIYSGSGSVGKGSMLYGAVLTESVNFIFKDTRTGGTHKKHYARGEIVGLCTCDEMEGYLAAMNVIGAFNGDKISTELSKLCFSGSWERYAKSSVSVTNVGEEAGAISYTRGAQSAGYRFGNKGAIGDMSAKEEKARWIHEVSMHFTREQPPQHSDVEESPPPPLDNVDSSSSTQENERQFELDPRVQGALENHHITSERIYVRHNNRERSRPSLSSMFDPPQAP